MCCIIWLALTRDPSLISAPNVVTNDNSKVSLVLPPVIAASF